MIQNLSIEKLQRVAAQITEVCSHSLVIGGGAPRDLLNGRPVKDIDVFIGLEGADEEMAGDWFDICTSVGELWPQIVKRRYDIWTPEGVKRGKWCQSADTWLGSNRGENPMLCLRNAKGYSYGAFSLVEFPVGPYCHSLQLVFIDIDPVENVRNHFDFGLSKVWVTPSQLRMDKAYWHDHFGQRITYLNSTEPNEQRRQSSVDRLGRLRTKYAGWRFERCGQLDAPAELTKEQA